MVAIDKIIGYNKIPCGLKPDSLLEYIVCKIARLISGYKSVTATPRICNVG
jgi:hypothetical protein